MAKKKMLVMVASELGVLTEIPNITRGGCEHVCLFCLHFKSLTNEAMRSAKAFYRAQDPQGFS